MKRINKTLLFILLTLGLSYLLAGLFYGLGGRYSTSGGVVLAVVYMYMPAVSAILITKVIHKEKIKEKLLISFKLNKWFVVAWLIPPLLSFATFGISLLFPHVSYSPGMEGMFDRYGKLMTPEQMDQMKKSLESMPLNPLWLGLIQGLAAGLTVNAVAGFGEELGWRGFLYNQFKHLNFIKASLTIGFVWGIWHAPLILMGHNYPQHPVIGVLIMTIWCILLSPLFLYITIKSESVIAAAIMHGTLNGTAGISILLVAGGNDLIVGTTGLAGFIALIIFILVLFIYDTWISKEKIMLKEKIDFNQFKV